MLHVFTGICQRILRFPKLAIDLTGGNDTRLSAAVLAAYMPADASSRIIFQVRQAPEHPDAVIAKKIAEMYNWKFYRHDRNLDIEESTEDLLFRIAPFSDGNRYPSSLANDITHIESNWSDFHYFWGSLGGELCRDLFWHQELLSLGLTHKVNYNAFLNRLKASPYIDINRISSKKLTQKNHNEYLLSFYRHIGEMRSNQTNAYKLDRMQLYLYSSMNDTWSVSAWRTRILPFFTSELLNVCLTIPWHHRVARRLTTALIMKLEPELARIANDKGAPMAPLSWRNSNEYLRYAYQFVLSGCSRRILRKKLTPAYGFIPNVRRPKQWMHWILKNGSPLLTSGSQKLFDRALQNAPLRTEEEYEIEMLMLIAALKRAYPGIQETFDFNPQDPLITAEGRIF